MADGADSADNTDSANDGVDIALTAVFLVALHCPISSSSPSLVCCAGGLEV